MIGKTSTEEHEEPMKLWRSIAMIVSPGLSTTFFLAVSVWAVYGQDIHKEDKLGEEFQRQMPYSKERPQSGETPGQPQPKDYIAPTEKEKTDTTQSQMHERPVCYNPYYGKYEPCYPRDSEQWRFFYSLPHFQLWWDKWQNCPPGYHFRTGKGCFSN